MATTNRDLVEYRGIGTCNYSDMSYFNQVIRDFVFCIPDEKPDIEQIIRVWVTPSIVQKKVVVTPWGTSLEGQHMSGNKVMVCGDISYKVEYVADEPTQVLHTAHTMIPFCGYVVLADNFNANSFIAVSAVVEDVCSEQVDERSIYNNITMLLIPHLC